MPILLSTSNGNFTSSSSWSVVDPTSYLDNVTTVQTIPTTPANSASFTPGAITVSGIALQLYNRVNVVTGTMTVVLRNVTANADVVGTSVTVNASDIPNTNNTAGLGTRGIGWMYFKFAAPVTLLAATAYAVRLSTSVASQIGMWISATNNWNRALVTTTAAAPAVTDTLHINGDMTGPGTSVPRTITMDSTATTAYGTTYIGAYGNLTYGTAPSTNYIFRLTGNLFINRLGSLSIGTTASPIPSSSTARLEINVTTNGQFNIFINGGEFNTFGSYKDPDMLLTADAAVSATTLTINTTPVGWSSGDTIGIAGTGAVGTQSEIRTLTATPVTNSLSINSGLGFAKGGSSTTANAFVNADIINLTRNVVVTVGTTTTVATGIRVDGTDARVRCFNTLFLQVGTAGTTIAAFTIAPLSTQTFDVEINGCAFYMSTAVANNLGFYYSTAAQSAVGTCILKLKNSVFYNYGTPITQTPVDNTTIELDGNVFMRYASAAQLFDLRSLGPNNVFANSTTNGMTLAAQLISGRSSLPSVNTDLLNNLRCYGHSGFGLSFSNFTISTATSLTPVILTGNDWRIFRTGIGGIQITSFELFNSASAIRLNGLYMFGNTTFNISQAVGLNSKFFIESSFFWSGTSPNTAAAITGAASTNTPPVYTDTLFFTNCRFGITPNAIASNFGTAILQLDRLRGGGVVMYNPTFSGTIGIRNNTVNGYGYSVGGVIVFNENGGSNRRIYTNNATISTDTTITDVNPQSIRLAPGFSNFESPSSIVRVAIPSGSTREIQVNIRKSTTLDGSNYTGTQPRLKLKYNPLLTGINSDIIAATASSVNGVWETLTYTTPIALSDCIAEFVVECDGASGWINIDNWNAAAPSVNTKTSNYFAPFIGGYIEANPTSSGSGEKSYAYLT